MQQQIQEGRLTQIKTEITAGEITKNLGVPPTTLQRWRGLGLKSLGKLEVLGTLENGERIFERSCVEAFVAFWEKRRARKSSG